MHGVAVTLYRTLVAAWLCCPLVLGGCGGATTRTSATTSPERTPVRKIQIGGAPIGLVAYGGQLWVADAKTNRVVRVEPQSGQVTGEVSVGRTPLRVVGFKGSLWSTDFDAGTVSQVSPSGLRRVASIRVGPQPEGIVAFGPDLRIVSQQAGELVRLVPGAPAQPPGCPWGTSRVR